MPASVYLLNRVCLLLDIALDPDNEIETENINRVEQEKSNKRGSELDIKHFEDKIDQRPYDPAHASSRGKPW